MSTPNSPPGGCFPQYQVHRAITTIFGLHGLPLPVKATATAATAHRGLRVGPMPHKPPANVTPAVIYKTYNVKYAKAARSDKNRQAVAEFQVCLSLLCMRCLQAEQRHGRARAVGK